MTMYKLGRKPRIFKAFPRVGMLRAAAVALQNPSPTLPATLDNAEKLPPDVGMMENDRIGDCTCAGMGHLIQLWTQDAQGTEFTVPDSLVQQAYSEITGYNPANPASDTGADEQTVLAWWLNKGFPLPDGTRKKIVGAYEGNTRDMNGLCEIIMEFGAAYIGFEVPDGFMEDLPALWIPKPTYGATVGGHCVLLHGFDRTDPANPVFNVTTWGFNRQFRMTADFVRRYVDEAYGVVSAQWIMSTGKTPYGLTTEILEALGSELGIHLAAMAYVGRVSY